MPKLFHMNAVALKQDIFNAPTYLLRFYAYSQDAITVNERNLKNPCVINSNKSVQC